jgi:LuxR family maltose regulon positive regulatory protein
MVLIALGPTERWCAAAGLVAELRRQAEVAHAALALIDINALAAVLHDVEGRPDDAVAALRVSLASGAEARLATRYTFLPLPLAPIFRRLVHEPTAPAHATAALAALEAALAARQLPDRSEANREPAGGLTRREVAVVRCLNQRMTSNEIGEALFMSPNTARNHVAHIYAKLGVSTRHAAVARASELGLLA